MDLHGRVHRACHVDGMSKSEAARVCGMDRKTVVKILKHSAPPGYRRSKPPVRPKLDPFVPIIDQILEDDNCQLKKQRQTAKRFSSGCATSTGSPAASRSSPTTDRSMNPVAIF